MRLLHIHIVFQAAKDELPEEFDGALVLTVFESKGC